MISFHNDPSIKEKYLSRVIAHRKEDSIIQGLGWENDKGCAVGCTLENYDPSRYPIELGLPEWLARLEDIIFEKLPNELAIEWPEKFLFSIPVGIDVEKVKHKLSAHRLENLIKIQNENLLKHPYLKDIFIETINSIELVKKFHEAEINKNYCELDSEHSEKSSLADLSARSAKYLLVKSERLEYSSGYLAASSAWLAVRSAAESARSTVISQAESEYSAQMSLEFSSISTSWEQESEFLLKILSECK